MRMFAVIFITVVVMLGSACEKTPQYLAERAVEVQLYPSCDPAYETNYGTPQWTADFSDWMSDNGYAYMAQIGGWGGFEGDCVVEKDPVVFIHGAAGSANGFDIAFLRLQAVRNTLWKKYSRF